MDGSAIDRRALLRGTGQASLAAGLAAAGLSGITPASDISAHGARLQDTRCTRLTIVSKRAVETESDVECDRCECEDALTYHLQHRFRALLTEAKCDESGRVIPEGSVLEGSVERWLRVPGPCGTWVGYHRGTFSIEADGAVIIEGEISGTDGFDIHSEEPCCAPDYQEGVLIGKGLEKLKGCEFVASYHGAVPVENKEEPPCDARQWRGWELSLAGVLACPCGDTPPPPDCIDFDTLNLGDQYVVGDSFSAGSVTVKFVEFEWGNGTLTSNGFAEVQDGGMAGSSGNEMLINNINLVFDFGGTVSGVTIAFGEYGGNVNLDVNGDFQNVGDFMDLNGAVVGGATVAVTTNASGELGAIELTGSIQTVTIGGQELWIDDVCYTP
jgi:hypothetical protein